MVHPTSRRLLVVCGPSGSGKSTLIQKLFDEHPDKFGFSVSHQTRAPRAGEVDGVHYHFTTRDKFQQAVENGEFLEYAMYTNHLCGTSKEAVKKVWNEGKICVLDIDAQGVQQMKNKNNLESIFVFIKPPSMEVLEKRLRNRKTDSEENIQKRLNVAKSEMEFASKEGTFDLIILNDDLDKAYAELRAFIHKSFKNELE